MKKSLLAAALSALILTGCNSESVTTPEVTPEVTPVTKQVKFAQFNLSFATDGDATENYERWVKYMELSPEQQQEIIDNQVTEGSDPFIPLYQRIAQIRNVAAIIQKNRPDVLLMNEFNNDGIGEDMRMLEGFQKNYLGVPQSMNSVDGGDLLEPIHYPFSANYATNTGLPSNLNLDNDAGGSTTGPADAHGFGFYHGHYAFALLSKHEIDKENTRSFQTLLRKDMPDAFNPVIFETGENTYNEEEWNAVRMSSKNHVDAPIIVKTENGSITINALLAHPTPPMSDAADKTNHYRNSDENRFWMHYIEGYEFKDDKGSDKPFYGENFVIMGDLNADNVYGNMTKPEWNGIVQLMSHDKVNQNVSQPGTVFTPTSKGALEIELNNDNANHTNPEIRTSTWGARADYAVPSASLKVVDSGVYWVGAGEEGHLLFNDDRYEPGKDYSKAISSDHRMVWVTVEVTK